MKKMKTNQRMNKILSSPPPPPRFGFDEKMVNVQHPQGSIVAWGYRDEYVLEKNGNHICVYIYRYGYVCEVKKEGEKEGYQLRMGLADCANFYHIFLDGVTQLFSRHP